MDCMSGRWLPEERPQRKITAAATLAAVIAIGDVLHEVRLRLPLRLRLGRADARRRARARDRPRPVPRRAPGPRRGPASGAALLRSLTLLLFVIGTIGTTLDLVLLGPFENLRQLAPLLLMPTGLLLLFLRDPVRFRLAGRLSQ